MTTARPDLSTRPATCVVESAMKSSPHAIYQAWTQQFDRWFAARGTVLMGAEIDAPFFFEARHEGKRHPRYDRFLDPEVDRLVEITWVTGADGTEGAETVVRVEIAPRRSGASVRLTHSGFPNEASMKRHDKAWVQVLANQDKTLSGGA